MSFLQSIVKNHPRAYSTATVCCQEHKLCFLHDSKKDNAEAALDSLDKWIGAQSHLSPSIATRLSTLLSHLLAQSLELHEKQLENPKNQLARFNFLATATQSTQSINNLQPLISRMQSLIRSLTKTGFLQGIPNHQDDPKTVSQWICKRQYNPTITYNTNEQWEIQDAFNDTSDKSFPLTDALQDMSTWLKLHPCFSEDSLVDQKNYLQLLSLFDSNLAYIRAQLSQHQEKRSSLARAITYMNDRLYTNSNREKISPRLLLVDKLRNQVQQLKVLRPYCMTPNPGLPEPVMTRQPTRWDSSSSSHNHQEATSSQAAPDHTNTAETNINDENAALQARINALIK